MGKEDLSFNYQFAVYGGPSMDCRTFGAHMEQFSIVHQLLTRQGIALKTGPGNLGQDDLFAEVVDVSNQNPPCLGKSFQN